MKLTWQEAIKEAHRLHEKWVSFDKKIDLDRSHASMLQEYRWQTSPAGRLKVSCGLIAETRHELSILGKIRETCKRENMRLGVDAA